MDKRSLQTLSKDERTAALHELAEASLADFDLTGGSLMLLQDLVNTSFRVQHDSRQWYLRIYNPDRHNTSAIESELLFLEALTKGGFPAPRPLRKRSDGMLWVASQSPVVDAIRISVYSWLPGEILQHDRTPRHYANLGTVLARLHEFSTKWNPPAGFGRPRCDSGGIYGNHGASGSQVMRGWDNIDRPLRSDLEDAKRALEQAENAIGMDCGHYGLIHGDPSFGNVLFDGERPYLIDFDDFGYGHYVFDLAVILAGAWGKPDFEENRAALFEGYRQIRELSQAEMGAVPAAMAARAASLIFWAAAQSSQHPWIEGQWQRLQEYMES